MNNDYDILKLTVGLIIFDEIISFFPVTKSEIRYCITI